MAEQIRIDIISGCEGPCLTINDYRVAGPKAWGGGQVVQSFVTDMDRLRSALPSIPSVPIDEGMGRCERCGGTFLITDMIDGSDGELEYVCKECVKVLEAENEAVSSD